MVYKIVCEPVKNCVGKKTGEHIASFGTFSEVGNSKQEACDNLNTALEWFFLNDDLPTTLKQTVKRIYMLERGFYGYCVNYIEIGNKHSYPGGMLFGRVSEFEAKKIFEDYINSCVECSDDQFLE